MLWKEKEQEEKDERVEGNRREAMILELEKRRKEGEHGRTHLQE